MVKARKYIEYCLMADIPVSHTELDLLENMTDKNGWFDEEAYLVAMEQTPIYVTKNQRKLLSIMPKRYQRGGRYRARIKLLGKFLAQVHGYNTYSL